MKKAFKFLCGAASMAAVAFGAYCVYKNVVAKPDDDDFDDFEDYFEDETPEATADNREYVSINITEEVADTAEESAEELADAVEETAEELADTVEEVADTVEEAADAAEETAEELVNAAKNTAKDFVDALKRL